MFGSIDTRSQIVLTDVTNQRTGKMPTQVTDDR